MFNKLILIIALVWCALTLADPLDPIGRHRMKMPRVGRRGDGIVAEYDDSYQGDDDGYSSFFLKSSKSVPRLGRRQDSIDQKTWFEADTLPDLDMKSDKRWPSELEREQGIHRFALALNKMDNAGRQPVDLYQILGTMLNQRD